MRKFKEYVGAAIATLVCFFLVFGYVTYLQDHGCVIGTRCISITR